MTGSLLFLFLAVPLLAEEYSHRDWRTEDGLPQNRIRAISQTRDGLDPETRLRMITYRKSTNLHLTLLDRFGVEPEKIAIARVSWKNWS
jgi:hypothetical protein